MEKLQLSTLISPPRLQVTSNLIQNLRPWQSASSAQTGLNGRKQSRQNCTRSRNERYSHRLYLLLETFFLWDQNGFFIRKRNENNEVVRYKARLVAQGFTQRPGIDYDETYSPVMSGITFRYLISLAAQKGLSMHLMDVVTTYLYGSLNSDIYMKVPEGLDIPNKNHSRNMYCVKLQKSLYGLKQSGRMWYNRLKEFLLQKGFSNNDDCPCVFIKKSLSGFCIISVYVDDLNIIGSTRDIDEARNHLKTEFEMKDLGKTKFCLGFQLEHLPSGILVHQSAYI